MSLHVKDADVPKRQVVRTGVEGEGAMVVRRGYGNECSLMHAIRASGYHTTPHAHEAEQINYVLEGEIWFFVEERGFLCKAEEDRKSTRLNSSHSQISYAVFCLKKKKKQYREAYRIETATSSP